MLSISPDIPSISIPKPQRKPPTKVFSTPPTPFSTLAGASSSAKLPPA